MQAFEVARDNMETLLSKDSVEEVVEYGSSDKYPGIKWQTTVEMFDAPVMEEMQIWVRGICSAEYTDTAGQAQMIELTHWLTALTKEQVLQVLQERQGLLSEPNGTSEPNEPSEPNETPEPNELEFEPNELAPESRRDCDGLPFCESIMCHLEADRPVGNLLDIGTSAYSGKYSLVGLV